MGQFVNVGNKNFQRVRASEYIDKSELISHINSTLNTEFNMSCVTRCRRFGKSMAANMLCAYYDNSCDSRSLFADLKIANDPTFEAHLNKHPVIFVSMTDFISRYGHDKNLVDLVQNDLIEDLRQAYPQAQLEPKDDLMSFLQKIVALIDQPFFMIIDEWDAFCREFEIEEEVMDRYVNFLRRLFKGIHTSEVFIGAYITGILPIKKYDTQSALNNFREYTMIQPGKMAKYYGFTKEEVELLASKYNIDQIDLEQWYDGYRIGNELSMYNPNSVMTAINNGVCANYWSTSGAFENVSRYIQLNFDGLKEDIVKMMSGGQSTVAYTRFKNDLRTIACRDDVLTILIHLGYLSYNPITRKCYIPNREVRERLEETISDVAIPWRNLWHN